MIGVVAVLGFCVLLSSSSVAAFFLTGTEKEEDKKIEKEEEDFKSTGNVTVSGGGGVSDVDMGTNITASPSNTQGGGAAATSSTPGGTRIGKYTKLDGTNCFTGSADLGGIGRDLNTAMAECDKNPSCKGIHNNDGGDYWLLSNTDSRVPQPRNKCFAK